MRKLNLLALAAVACMLPHTGLAQQEIADRGDFKLYFHPGETEDESLLRDFLMSDGEIQALIDDINSEINLTQDVDVVFAPGTLIAEHWGLEPDDTVLAGYQDGVILYSYGKVGETINLFRRMDDFDDTLEDFVGKIQPVIETTLLHEIGHALIHVNGIAIAPGENEEVSADQLAFLIVSDFYDEPEDFLPVVVHYAHRANDPEQGATGPSPHPQDGTRAQNYLCWLFGYDPELFAPLVDYVEYGAEYCTNAYYDLAFGWAARLDPSFKESAEPDPEEIFYYLLEEEGYTLDQAIVEISTIYDDSVAVDLGVYLCSPEPHPACTGSEIQGTWYAFLALIEEGAGATATVDFLIDEGLNAAILKGIGVYWCSPEPGPGCGEDDVLMLAWTAFDAVAEQTGSPSEAVAYLSANLDPFIAELIGVFVCAHPTCYEGEEFVQVASVQQGPLRSSGLKRATPKRRSNMPPRRSARR